MLKILKKNHKKFLTFTLLVSIVFAVFFIFGAVNVSHATDDLGQNKIENINVPKIESSMFVVRIINWVLGFLGLIALIIVLYAGFLYLTAGGNAKQVEKAKKFLINGLIGLIIIVLSEAITLYVFYILGQKLAGANNGNNDGNNGGNNGGGIILPVSTFKINSILTDCEVVTENNRDVYLCSSIVVNFNNFLDKDSAQSSFASGHLKIEECADSNCTSVREPDFYPANFVDNLTGATNSSWFANGRSLTFYHQRLFKSHQTYRLVIPKTLKDKSGTLLDQNNGCGSSLNIIPGCITSADSYLWTFTTGEKTDSIAPEIISSYPVGVGENNYPNRSVFAQSILKVKFSEKLDPSTINKDNIKINIITGTVSPQGVGGTRGATLENYDVSLNSDGTSFDIYNLNLEKFTWYEISVSNIRDLCNNVMTGNVVWRFETNDTSPGVSLKYPSANYSRACPNTPVYVVFNTSMYNSETESCAVNQDGIGGGLVTSGTLLPNNHNRILQVTDDYVVGNDPNNYCKHYEFLPTTNLLTAGQEYSVNIATEALINSNGDKLTANWTFNVATEDTCSNEAITCNTNANMCALSSYYCPAHSSCELTADNTCQCVPEDNSIDDPVTNNQRCGDIVNGLCQNALNSQCTDPNYPICNPGICRCVRENIPTNNQRCGDIVDAFCQNGLNSQCTDPDYPLCNRSICQCVARSTTDNTNHQPCDANIVAGVMCNQPNNNMCTDVDFPICDPHSCECVSSESADLPLEILGINHPNYSTAICLNSVVARLFFNQPLNQSSLNNNTILYERRHLTATDPLCVVPNPFVAGDYWCQIKINLQSFLVKEGATFDVQTLSCNNPDGCAEIKITAPNVLVKNRNYRLIIKGGDEGIKSVAGTALATDFQWQFATNATAHVCAINQIEIRPATYTFTRVAETQTFEAIAKTKDDIELSAVADVYNWSWRWGKVDQKNISALTNSTSATETVTARNVNGEATLIAEAKIITDILNHTEDKTFTGYAEITNFLCLNPWPIYEDRGAYANFSLFYCRDKGLADTADDLPALRRPVVVSNDANVKKEYLFLRTDDSTDAIGLRIFANDDFLSPSVWYQAQNFLNKSNPQTTSVDGYSAVRDGRSVYVAATNLTNNAIHSNIYVLSYNENASAETIEIYQKLLDSWTFNINPEITNRKLCPDNTTYCETDAACPDNGTCDAMKTKLIRDNKRITDLGSLKRNLNIAYENSNTDITQRTYPLLGAGSYEIGHSTSKWPSWTSAFTSALGASAPVDPLNNFNLPCVANEEDNSLYDTESCWNESTKTYICPAGSHIYEYWSINAGTNFQIYANMEYEGPGTWITGSLNGCHNFVLTK